METTFWRKRMKTLLAKELGVTKGMVSRWVNGDTLPNTKMAERLEEATGKVCGEPINAECWLLRRKFPHPGLKNKEAV